MSQRLRIVVVLIAVLAIGAWILVEARDAVPVREGTAAGFWRHACDVNLDQCKDRGSWGAFYAPREGWCIYYDQYMHGQIIYRVKESLVLEDFPRVRAAVAVGPEVPVGSWQGKALEAWKRADPHGKSPECLFAEIKKASSEAMLQEHPDWSKIEEAWDAAFAIRWARAKRYWLTVAFEFTMLAGLLVFATIPWLRNAGRCACSIHVGALPVLLLVPWFLGYVPWAFTSLCPAGGIVYPYVISPFRLLPSTNVDQFILSQLPKPLEPLTQSEGPWMAATGMGSPGPVTLLVFGAMLGASCFVVATFLGRVRGKLTSNRPEEL